MSDSDLPAIIERLRSVEWKWNKAGMDAIAASIGLTDREPDSNWIKFRLPGTSLQPVYRARNQEVLSLQIRLASFDIGEFVNEENFSEILETQYASFEKKFEQSARQIAKILGPPSFKGGQDDAGYDQQQPDVWGAMHVAVWTVKNGRLILMCDHQDKELPITLELSVAPLEPKL